MIKPFSFTFLFLVLMCSYTRAQFGSFATGGSQAPAHHAQWELTTKKISDCEYDLIFSVTLEKGWHTFSIQKIKGAELEVFPTQITFNPGKEYSLVGQLTETKPTAEFDETINKTVLLHYKKVVFTQRVKLLVSGPLKINGRYEYQVCKESCEKPPYKKFEFDLQATKSCLK